LPQLETPSRSSPAGQAQVDRGDEGGILLAAGISKVYSFHMTLSYSRYLFCCFVTSQQLGAPTQQGSG
jgi:hypothetical protein